MKRVLIVEDERDLLDSLKEFFEDEGFSVQTAANGVEALSVLDTEELPSVVLLDLAMPILDGNELYARMRAEPRLANIPVIVSTSDPSRAPSGVLIMKKPVNLSSLLGAIQLHGQAG